MVTNQQPTQPIVSKQQKDTSLSNNYSYHYKYYYHYNYHYHYHYYSHTQLSFNQSIFLQKFLVGPTETILVTVLAQVICVAVFVCPHFFNY